DAGGHRGGGGEGYAGCGGGGSEDQEAGAGNVVAIGDGNRVPGRLVGGGEDGHRRAGPKLPRKRARCTKDLKNPGVSLLPAEPGGGAQRVLQGSGRGHVDLLRMQGSCEEKGSQKESHRD